VHRHNLVLAVQGFLLRLMVLLPLVGVVVAVAVLQILQEVLAVLVAVVTVETQILMELLELPIQVAVEVHWALVLKLAQNLLVQVALELLLFVTLAPNVELVAL
jgi:hypothetical protein